MRFQGTFTERDLSSARALLPSPDGPLRRERTASGVAVILSLALALLSFWIAAGQTVFWLLLALANGVAGVWKDRRRRNQLREDATLDGTISGTLSDGGFTYHTPLRQTSWAWDQDRLAYVAADGLLLLLTRGGRWALLARTLFASEDEWTAAVQYVKARLPEHGRRGRDLWTPVGLAILVLVVLFLAWHYARLARLLP